MQFFCIADEETVRGFRLAGVAGRVVTNAEDAATAFSIATERPELGLLILTQAVAAGIREHVDRFRLERDRPLLVEIPGPAGPLPGPNTLRQLVHAAVGICLDEEEKPV